MLEIKGLRGGYPDREVLQDVSLALEPGQVSVLVGPNGCGKSTLLKTLCGILAPQGGEVLLDGENLLTMKGQERAKRVAYLPQERRLPDITVERMVLHGRFPYLGYPRRYRGEDHAAARAAMERMGLTELAEQPLQKLSGGQRQKVYIAMALAQDTPVILLDEPVTYLDVGHQLQLMEVIRALGREGKTVLMVLHDLPHAMAVADRVILMEQGRIAQQGTAEEVCLGGEIGRIFGVALRRVKTEDGWQYYCVAQ